MWRTRMSNRLGFGVWGLGFGIWGLGFGVWGLGFFECAADAHAHQGFRIDFIFSENPYFSNVALAQV